jgi:hypothetical protein
VFDERTSVGPAEGGGVTVGQCLACALPYDDYGGRHRCGKCRLLVLVCEACAARPEMELGPVLCELCWPPASQG